MKTIALLLCLASFVAHGGDRLSRIGMFVGGAPEHLDLSSPPLPRYASEIRKVNGTNYDVGTIRERLDALAAVGKPPPEGGWKQLKGEVIGRTPEGIVIRSKWKASVVVSEQLAVDRGVRYKVGETLEEEERFGPPTLLVNHPRAELVEVGEEITALALRTGTAQWAKTKRVAAETIDRYDHGTAPTVEEIDAAQAAQKAKAEEKKRKADEAVRKFREEQAAKAAAEASSVAGK